MEERLAGLHVRGMSDLCAPACVLIDPNLFEDLKSIAGDEVSTLVKKTSNNLRTKRDGLSTLLKEALGPKIEDEWWKQQQEVCKVRIQALQDQINKCKEEMQRVEETSENLNKRRIELGATDSGSRLGTPINGTGLLKGLFADGQETKAQGKSHAGDNVQNKRQKVEQKTPPQCPVLQDKFILSYIISFIAAKPCLRSVALVDKQFSEGVKNGVQSLKIHLKHLHLLKKFTNLHTVHISLFPVYGPLSKCERAGLKGGSIASTLSSLSKKLVSLTLDKSTVRHVYPYAAEEEPDAPKLLLAMIRKKGLPKLERLELVAGDHPACSILKPVMKAALLDSKIFPALKSITLEGFGVYSHLPTSIAKKLESNKSSPLQTIHLGKSPLFLSSIVDVENLGKLDRLLPNGIQSISLRGYVSEAYQAIKQNLSAGVLSKCETLSWKTRTGIPLNAFNLMPLAGQTVIDLYCDVDLGLGGTAYNISPGSFPRLKRLTLRHIDNKYQARSLPNLLMAPGDQLEYLKVSNFVVGKTQEKEIRAVFLKAPWRTKLVSLTLEGTEGYVLLEKRDTASVVLLCALTHGGNSSLSSLESLVMTNWVLGRVQIMKVTAAFEKGWLPRLKKLDFSSNRLEDSDTLGLVRSVASCKPLLTDLRLAGLQQTWAGAIGAVEILKDRLSCLGKGKMQLDLIKDIPQRLSKAFFSDLAWDLKERIKALQGEKYFNTKEEQQMSKIVHGIASEVIGGAIKEGQLGN